MIYRQNILLGGLFILLAELLFASMGATVKSLALSGVSSEISVFMRNMFGLIVLLPLITVNRNISLKTEVIHLHLLRGLSGLAAMYCFFYALSNIALAEGMLLKMTSPLFMPLIAAFWLGEKLHGMTLIAVSIGFAGVIVVLQPGGGTLNIVALIGLAGGALAALAKTSLRRLGKTEPTVRVVFYFATIGSLVSAIPMLLAWQPLNNEQWFKLMALGLFGTLAQLLLTRGYAIAPPGRMSPLTYTSVIFGAAYGYLFWGEVPASTFVIGALMIAFAGVLTLQHRLRDREKAIDSA